MSDEASLVDTPMSVSVCKLVLQYVETSSSSLEVLIMDSWLQGPSSLSSTMEGTTLEMLDRGCDLGSTIERIVLETGDRGREMGGSWHIAWVDIKL